MTTAANPVGVALTLSEPREARETRAAVRALAATFIRNTIRLDDVELMTSEAITNALVHGSGVVDVHVHASQDLLRVEVWDQGPNYEPDSAERIDFGRGLMVIKAMSTWCRLDISPRATCLAFEVALKESCT